MEQIELQKRCAVRRLFRDWKEIEDQRDDLSTIAALPTSDIFLWHCNIRPLDGPFAGTIFHLILEFPDDYPHGPPRCLLCTLMDHPNVFDHDYICLDMIQRRSTRRPYEGWTSAYSVLSILMQLQSFLFAENVPQEGYGDRYSKAHQNQYSIDEAIIEARAFVFPSIKTHDGSIVQHTHRNPWPPFSDIKSSPSTSPSQRPAPPLAHGKRSVITGPSMTEVLPSCVCTHIFGFLDPKELLKVRNVCSRWRSIVCSHNLFERTQISCFHSKARLDEPADTMLGFGISVEYYPGGKSLKGATSPLDLLSWHAFNVEQVRTGVWGGASERFDYFLPLVFQEKHATKAEPIMKRTIFEITKHSRLPGMSIGLAHKQFRPEMAFQLLAVLMNSMAVQMMNSVGNVHASEKALEGYCAFHHLLLYFAKKYPSIIALANNQIESFANSPETRLKRNTPNLGVLLVSLTLSHMGWDSIMVPLVKEVLDRNVRWNLREYPELESMYLRDYERLESTFEASKTSLRLLMFQVYFLKTIGRPSDSRGPMDVLKRCEQRMGIPSLAQKENLVEESKKILAVYTWEGFFHKIGSGDDVPTKELLVEMLKEAIENSKRKGYHRSRHENRFGYHRSRNDDRDGYHRSHNDNRGGRNNKRRYHHYQGPSSYSSSTTNDRYGSSGRSGYGPSWRRRYT